GSPWEAFSYEQFSPDTSDVPRGNAAADILRPPLAVGSYPYGSAASTSPGFHRRAAERSATPVAEKFPHI
ncbi:hypothetical protein, partial [Stutzerimonas nitrititolerans]|uniref:hypothetical protein n=1 Tax=Stutzerimonas nitrititolerans TaxID=2482751 RepID=UPI00289A9D49